MEKVCALDNILTIEIVCFCVSFRGRSDQAIHFGCHVIFLSPG